MFKAAIERGESDARISYPEREQARSAASMFNVQCFLIPQVLPIGISANASY